MGQYVLTRAKIWVPFAALIFYTLLAIPAVLTSVHGQDIPTAERLGVVEGKQDSMEKRLEAMPSRVEAMETRTIRVEYKVDRMESFTMWAIGVLVSIAVGVFSNLAVSAWSASKSKREASSGSIPLYRPHRKRE